MPRSPLFHSIATRRSCGNISLSRDRRLVESVVATSDRPVTLPPGRARLATRPAATGSPEPVAMTVGMPDDLAAGRETLGPESPELLLPALTSTHLAEPIRGHTPHVTPPIPLTPHPPL